MAHVFYFGCWNEAGHFLHHPSGRSSGSEWRHLEYFGGAQYIHIDGALAPRTTGRDHRYAPDWLAPGSLCWQGQGKTIDERRRIHYDSDEYPQGRYLLHVLDTGYTAIQWWDRCQGDDRGACNSTILLEGQHTADEMVAALREHFPHVLANLEKHGVKLVEVVTPTQERP